MTSHMSSWILKKSPMLPIRHFERLLDKRYHIYNLSCCYWLNIIFNWQKSTTPSCNGNHRLHNKCFAIMTNFRFTNKTFFCCCFFLHKIDIWKMFIMIDSTRSGLLTAIQSPFNHILPFWYWWRQKCVPWLTIFIACTS